MNTGIGQDAPMLSLEITPLHIHIRVQNYRNGIRKKFGVDLLNFLFGVLKVVIVSCEIYCLCNIRCYDGMEWVINK